MFDVMLCKQCIICNVLLIFVILFIQSLGLILQKVAFLFLVHEDMDNGESDCL